MQRNLEGFMSTSVIGFWTAEMSFGCSAAKGILGFFDFYQIRPACGEKSQHLSCV